MVVQSCQYLQLVIDKKLCIFFYALLVQHAIRVVLVVVVIKLAAWNRLPVYVHHDGVVLSIGTNACNKKQK